MPADIERSDTTRVLVCQGCKFGCVLTVDLDEQGGVAQVSGNTCDRGIEYAHKVIAGEGEAGEAPGATAEGESSEPGEPVVEEHTGGYREFRCRHKR